MLFHRRLFWIFYAISKAFSETAVTQSAYFSIQRHWQRLYLAEDHLRQEVVAPALFEAVTPLPGRTVGLVSSNQVQMMQKYSQCEQEVQFVLQEEAVVHRNYWLTQLQFQTHEQSQEDDNPVLLVATKKAYQNAATGHQKSCLHLESLQRHHIQSAATVLTPDFYLF